MATALSQMFLLTIVAFKRKVIVTITFLLKATIDDNLDQVKKSFFITYIKSKLHIQSGPSMMS